MRGLTALGAASRAELPLVVPNGYRDYRATTPVWTEYAEFCGPACVISPAQKHPNRSMWSFDVESHGHRLRVSFFGPHPSRSKDWADLQVGRDLYLKGILRQFGHVLTLAKAQRVPISTGASRQPIAPFLK